MFITGYSMDGLFYKRRVFHLTIHHRDQRAVAEADQCGHVDAVEQLARLSAAQHGRLAGLDDVLGPAHCMGRIGRDHVASKEPVEQRADRGEVLLDRRLLEFLAEASDIGGDVHRFDVGELIDILARIAPDEEAPAGVEIR